MFLSYDPSSFFTLIISFIMYPVLFFQEHYRNYVVQDNVSSNGSFHLHIPGDSDWYSRPYIFFILRKKYSKPYIFVNRL
jgi:hypothetical protein